VRLLYPVSFARTYNMPLVLGELSAHTRGLDDMAIAAYGFE
jgi:hypothetical protein